MDLINRTELMEQIKTAAKRSAANEKAPLNLPFAEVLELIIDAPEVEAVQVRHEIIDQQADDWEPMWKGKWDGE